MKKIILFLSLIAIILACGENQSPNLKIGRFQTETDLLLANFDCKTDVDDLHSVAGVFTILSNPRFSGIRFHAVAGAYGIQEGLYVPANELFEAAFKSNWSDAHSDFNKALMEVSEIAVRTLERGGKIWIAEAGQSDFSAALLKQLKLNNPDADIKNKFTVVQHSEWNENVTSPEAIDYLKNNCTYIKIPDGNEVGNGTPGLRSSKRIDLKNYISSREILKIWNLAIGIANRYNGQEERYLNQSIADGGIDFSDVSEACWIFGYENIVDVEDFFRKFTKQPVEN